MHAFTASHFKMAGQRRESRATPSGAALFSTLVMHSDKDLSENLSTQLSTMTVGKAGGVSGLVIAREPPPRWCGNTGGPLPIGHTVIERANRWSLPPDAKSPSCIRTPSMSGGSSHLRV